MSGRRRRERITTEDLVQEEEEAPVEAYIEEHAEAEIGADEAELQEEAKVEAELGNGEEDPKAKAELTNLPELGADEPQFDEWNADRLRAWLRDHNVKGTWSKKLTQKCREVWDEMQSMLTVRSMAMNGEAAVADGIPLGGSQGVPAETEPPDFSSWTIDRKRTYLRRREVKGIWKKHVDEKCLEVWRAEHNGEKYIHTPPSLGKTIKNKFPGQSVIAMPATAVMTGTAEVNFSADNISQLAAISHRQGLKGVSAYLNEWTKTVNHNANPEQVEEATFAVPEAHHSPPPSPTKPAPSPAAPPSHTGEREFQWIDAEITERGLRMPRMKRMSNNFTPTSAKRKKLAEEPVVEEEAPMHVLNDEAILQHPHVLALMQQISELEAENASLRAELEGYRPAPN